MDFKIGEGFRVEGTEASVNLADQSDDVVKAAYEEAQQVGVERGLWTPASSGSLAVASEVEPPAATTESASSEEEIVSIREQLLSTAVEGAKLYIGAIRGINAGRGRKDRIPVLKPGDYRERAEDWLTKNRETAAQQLPSTENRPRLLVPRLNRSITHEENVDAWKTSAGGNLWAWRGRMKFLSNWTENELSGYEPERDEQTPFIILPTAYDKAREGTVSKQTERLSNLYPEIDVAAIFDGVVLARRYMGQTRRWQDSYVRAINLEPKKVGLVGPARYVPNADVYGDGRAAVDGSRVSYDLAARLRVR